MESLSPSNSELHDFIEFLYGGLSGLAYVATKNPENPLEWTTNFIPFPEEAARLETVILSSKNSAEVYLSPALYKAPKPVRENFKASNVVWTEFDGNAPDANDYGELPQPSLRIRSSSDQNQHVYWRLNEPITNVEALEGITRRITFSFSADSSAWDATQVLRPPSTYNHKRQASVNVLSSNSTTYDTDIFGVLPEAPAQIDTSNWQLGSLPHVEDVILKYAFPPDLVLLLKKEKDEVKDRSASLMNLAYGCAEIGMTDPEIFVCLKLADDRWGKFKERTDRNKRLAHIITVARHKHPGEESAHDEFAIVMDFLTFLNTEVEIDWVIEPMLMEGGSMLLVGPSGIGKTQISLRFMINLALGKDFLHYKISKPRKILFLSLEMGFGELKVFVEAMAKGLSQEDLMLLQENLILVPHGEKWALNTPVGQEHLLRMVKEIEPDGIFTDSVGSSIQGSINDDESVQALLDFNDRLRKKYGCFLWYIHHMRKSTNGGATPSSQDDVYGNQYFINRATSSYGVLRARDGLIRIRNFKNRLYKTEDDYLVKRVEGLDFQAVNKEIDEKLTKIEYKKPEHEKGPAKGEVIGKFEI